MFIYEYAKFYSIILIYIEVRNNSILNSFYTRVVSIFPNIGFELLSQMTLIVFISSYIALTLYNAYKFTTTVSQKLEMIPSIQLTGIYLLYSKVYGIYNQIFKQEEMSVNLYFRNMKKTIMRN